MLEVAIPLIIYLKSTVCAPNKTEALNLPVFNMIIGINDSKTLTKQISCECKCNFNGTKCNSNQKWKNNKFWCEYKNSKEHNAGKKYLFGILLHTAAKMANM